MTGNLKSLAGLVAEYCRGLKFSDIPPQVVEAAKDRLLDALGVGLAAASLATTPKLHAALADLGRGGQGTTLGQAEPLPAASAALLNGTLIHSLEYDDTHLPSVIHGSAVVVPAALAMAEELGASGAELLKAVVLGWEVLVRLGLAAPGLFQANGFQTTAVCGPFAAAAVSAALIGLGADKTIDALGVAGSQCGGVFEFLWEGTTVKAMHPGWAAHAGLIAAKLSAAGLTGPSTILEGRFGLYNTYARSSSAGAKLRDLLASLGDVYFLPEVSVKLFPCCHYIHSFLECLEKLVAEGVNPAQVESVHCLVPAEETPIICEPWEKRLNPYSGYEAKFSLPYCLAALLLRGKIDVETFDRPRPDREILAAARRVSYSPLADSGFPLRFPGHVTLKTKSGRMIEASVPDVKGSPVRPASPAEVRAKFMNNAGRSLRPGAAEALEKEIGRLEKADHLAALSQALRSVKNEKIP
ncbi:MAG: MmgE/PrpD family protein [Thermodesulfobacteriota bacterium]